MNGYQVFTVKFGTHTLVGDVLSNNSTAHALVLHGAGESGRLRIRYFREHIYAEGVSSCAFDFIGHGDTGGELKHTSLYERTQQACKIIDTLKIRRPLTVVAASMGVSTAVKLLEHYEIEKFVFLVPAIYAAAAYTVPFGAGFSEIIRKPNSWLTSDTWDLLSEYTGRLFVVAAEKDEVIPPGVIEKIRTSSVNAKEVQFYTAPNAPHFVLAYMRSNAPVELGRVLGSIVQMIKK